MCDSGAIDFSPPSAIYIVDLRIVVVAVVVRSGCGFCVWDIARVCVKLCILDANGWEV